MKVLNYKKFANSASKASIDIFITCASFEERCFVTSELANQFNPKTRIIFFNENEVLEIKDNAFALERLAPDTSKVIPLNSNNPVGNYIKIIQTLNELEQGNPTVLIDITTFTHETLLVLLRILDIKKGKLNQVLISYVGAQDYSTQSVSAEEKWLSKGVDEIRTVIGYPGFTDPTKENHLMVLFGFEFDRTKKIIEEYQYDKITLGFGDESIQNVHKKINFDRHKNLLSEYPEAREFKFSLRDPIETKKQIISYLQHVDLKDCNTVIAPLNNKLSTIGAGLASIENPSIQLAYAKASLYNTKGYSKPCNEIYFGELEW